MATKATKKLSYLCEDGPYSGYRLWLSPYADNTLTFRVTSSEAYGRTGQTRRSVNWCGFYQNRIGKLYWVDQTGVYGEGPKTGLIFMGKY